jgi:hypothetical protein
MDDLELCLIMCHYMFVRVCKESISIIRCTSNTQNQLKNIINPIVQNPAEAIVSYSAIQKIPVAGKLKVY